VARDEAIENQLHTHCNWQSNTSACLAAARDIVETLKTTRRPSPALPRSVIDLRDRISFWRAVRRDRLHTNFNYREGYHPLPDYLDEMVDIMLEREARGEKTTEAPALRAAAAG